MIVLVTFTAGLVLWIAAWAFGIKPFDAFLFISIVTALAAGARIAQPYVQRRLDSTPLPPGER